MEPAFALTAQDNGDASLRKMRRVDWRWAVAKGFLDKETNQWNEALGGLEGYLRQRTESVLARCPLSRYCCLSHPLIG